MADENTKNPLFEKYTIHEDRWNRMYPYRLLIIDISKGNSIVGINELENQSVEDINNLTDSLTNGSAYNPAKKFISTITHQVSGSGVGGISYLLYQEHISGFMSISLPITPQQLSIVDQYAINTIATAKGIVEEHSGVRFKMISASGTTGIFPNRRTVGVLHSTNSLQDMFKNTLNSVNSIVGAAKGLASTVGSMLGGNTKEPEPIPDAKLTGYYKALELQKFLEDYAQAKKDPQNANWRLVFDIPKQKQSYVVTPMSFTLSQSASKPMEYNWAIQLKAWKRVEIGEIPYASQVILKLTPSTLAGGLASLRKLNRLLGDVRSTISAFRSDIFGVFELLRQVTVFAKNLAGTAKDLHDLKKNIKNDINGQILELLGKNKSIPFKTSDGKSIGRTVTFAEGMAAPTQEERKKAAILAIQVRNAENEGKQTPLSQSDPLIQVFEQPERFYDLLADIKVSQLNLTDAQKDAVKDDTDEINRITVSDLKEFKEQFKNLAYDLTNYYGAGSQLISTLYNKPTPITRILPLSVEENETISAIYEVIQFIDALTATQKIDDDKKQNPMQYVGGLANASSIPFEIASSKLLVPVPYNLTIEQIAMRYLGSPDKWLEIVTLNNLKAPYLDEVGYSYKLTSNATGRQFVIKEDETNKVYIGQKIQISSTTVPAIFRKIISVDRIDENTTLISVDGEADLDIFKLADLATIKGYQYGTTNSQNQIYLPINAPAMPDDRVSIPNHLKEEKFAKISKVDILLDDSGDIALNEVGDVLLANGITNLIQALKIKIRTKKGTLLRHPNFGLSINPGMSIADLQSGQLMADMTKLVTEDPRFGGIARLDLRLKGPVLSVDMAVTIKGDTGIVPITFDV